MKRKNRNNGFQDFGYSFQPLSNISSIFLHMTNAICSNGIKTNPISKISLIPLPIRYALSGLIWVDFKFLSFYVLSNNSNFYLHCLYPRSYQHIYPSFQRITGFIFSYLYFDILSIQTFGFIIICYINISYFISYFLLHNIQSR